MPNDAITIRKKALGELKKFVLAKQAEDSHDEVQAHVEEHLEHLAMVFGVSPEILREGIELRLTEQAEGLAMIALLRGLDADKLAEYVRDHRVELSDVLALQESSIEKTAKDRFFPLVLDRREAHWRGHLTATIVSQIAKTAKELREKGRDADLERAQEAARQLGAVSAGGTITFDAEKFFATCLLGQQDEDTCVFVPPGFDAADGWRDATSVYVPMWRLKDAARALRGKKIEARVFEDRRGRRLSLSWTNAFGRKSALNLRGSEPKIGARVVIIQSSPAKSEVAA